MNFCQKNRQGYPMQGFGRVISSIVLDVKKSSFYLQKYLKKIKVLLSELFMSRTMQAGLLKKWKKYPFFGQLDQNLQETEHIEKRKYFRLLWKPNTSQFQNRSTQKLHPFQWIYID